VNLILLALLTVQSAAPAKVPLVAITRLHAIKVDSAEVDVIGESLASALVSTGKVRVMERSQMNQILTEQGFQQSGACEGGDCAVQVGKLLGVDRLVVGSVGRVGETCALNLRTVDVTTGEVVGISSRTVQGGLEAVIRILPEAAKELVGIPPAEQPAPPMPVTVPAGPAKSYFGFRFIRPGALLQQTLNSLHQTGDTGVLVSVVVRDSPAAKGGLRVDDLVLEVDGTPIRGIEQLQALLANHQPGDNVVFQVQRGRKLLSLNLVAGNRP
jgi:S1-C subfamily serine protease